MEEMQKKLEEAEQRVQSLEEEKDMCVVLSFIVRIGVWPGR